MAEGPTPGELPMVSSDDREPFARNDVHMVQPDLARCFARLAADRLMARQFAHDFARQCDGHGFAALTRHAQHFQRHDVGSLVLPHARHASARAAQRVAATP